MKKDYTVTELIAMVQAFCEERDWDQFHNPKDLAIGISTEANELLDIFRFQNGDDICRLMKDAKKREHIEEELADVFFFVLRFAQMNDMDLKDILEKKIAKNAAKYPADRARGSNAKYNELGEMSENTQVSSRAPQPPKNPDADENGGAGDSGGQMPDRISRASMADGSILRQMKIRFLSDKNQNNLLALLSCLRDSDVYLPVKNSEKKSQLEDTGELLLQVDILEDEGNEKYYPIFSSKEVIPAEYLEKIELINLPMVKCIAMYREMSDLSGMVLDPFMDAFVMTPQIAQVVSELESHLMTEDK